MSLACSHLLPGLSRIVEEYLPEQERLRLNLPASIIEYEINPFLSLLDEAMIEAEYYQNGGSINHQKWLHKLLTLHPQVYTRITTFPNLDTGIRKLPWNYKLTDDAMIILLMLLQHESMNIWGRTQNDEVLLLAVMLSSQSRNKIFDVLLERAYSPWFLTAIYLLQHGATTTVEALMRIIQRTPFNERDDSYTKFITFIANHPELYDSPTTILNIDYNDSGERIPLYAEYLNTDPVFAAQLLDTPGLDLEKVFYIGGDITTYLVLAITDLPAEADDDYVIKQRLYQQIIRTLVSRHPNLVQIGIEEFGLSTFIDEAFAEE